MSDPKDSLIYALSSQLLDWVGRFLFLHVESSLSNPVILVGTENLSKEFDGGGSGHHGESLDRFLNNVTHVRTEADTSPLKHLCMLWEVRYHTLYFICNVLFPVSRRNYFWEFVHEVLPLLQQIHHFLVLNNSCRGIDFVIVLGILDPEVGLLNQCRYLFKLLVAVIGVVQHDAVEDLGEVGVQVGLDRHAELLHLLQLLLQLVQCLEANAHFVFLF